MKISIIAALQEGDRGIGLNGKDLYRFLPDRNHFQELTMGHPIIMGRKTWQEIPEERRPLGGRDNIVISRNKDFEAPGAIVHHSIPEAISGIQKLTNGEIFIIGGGEIYTQSIAYANRLYLTIIKGEKEADTFFPEYESFREVSCESHTYTSKKTGKIFVYDFALYM